MNIYCCEHEWSAMLTCIYEAWMAGNSHSDNKLVFEPVKQYTLFDNYIHVKSDFAKANKVMNAIKRKISSHVYYQLAYTSMAYEEDILDITYRILILGFRLNKEDESYNSKILDLGNGKTRYSQKAKDILNMTQYRDIFRFNEIHNRLSKEVNRFQEVSRFHEVSAGLFVAHIEPKSRLVLALGPIFADRMPSEYFIIVDDVHREAVVHPKDEECYIRALSETEYYKLLETENCNDKFTDMWKCFFEAIAIKERTNIDCQNNLFPKWARKHAIEFL